MTERTYTYVIDELMQQVQPDGAVILAKVIAFCGDGDECQLSQQWLASVMGVSKDTIRRALAKLQNLGFIECEIRCGAGNMTKIKKGSKLQPFADDKKVAKCNLKRSQNATKKGSKLQPNTNNKNNNKIIVCNNAPTRVIDKQFLVFWDLFAADEKHQEEKDRAAEVWSQLDDTAHADILDGLKHNDRQRRDNGTQQLSPFLYLKDYTPTRNNIYSRSAIYTKYETDSPEGFCILKERDHKGNIRLCRTMAAQVMNKQIQRLC